MYQKTFGNEAQITFNNEHEYYELIGFLAKSNKEFTQISWEKNDEKGTAWKPEGRIQFYQDPPKGLSAYLKHTSGNGSNIISRVNCNEFIKDLFNNFSFKDNKIQNTEEIRKTIPDKFLEDFDRGNLL